MLRNRSFQNAWRRRSHGVDQVLKKKRKNPAQLELDFCAEPWRPLVAVAAAAAVKRDRPMTDDELAAEFERLFP